LDERPLPAEQFPALEALTGFAHCFVGRVPGIDVREDKAEALRRLDAVHRRVRIGTGLADAHFVTAEQVHGDRVASAAATEFADECITGCDGLITNQPGVCLGIYVADCCAVYFVDPVRRAIGLVHSGKKGTELGIAGKAIDLMSERFGSNPEHLVVQLSPCIRPPHYEMDFAPDIVAICRDRGVSAIHDSGVCTACHLDRYYSYRAEKAKTGRMLALLAIPSEAATT
jgi:copper oxidase (laccase) domain-containing protein